MFYNSPILEYTTLLFHENEEAVHLQSAINDRMSGVLTGENIQSQLKRRRHVQTAQHLKKGCFHLQLLHNDETKKGKYKESLSPSGDQEY